jgi:RND superfamily putative drug exporter
VRVDGRTPAQGTLAALARWIYHHRKLTVLAWVVVLVATALLSGAFGGHYHADYLTPGSDSKAATEMIRTDFPGNRGESLQVVWKSPEGADSPATKKRIGAMLKEVDEQRGLGSPPPLAQAQISRDGTIGTLDVPLAIDSGRFTIKDSDALTAIANEASGDGLQVAMNASFFQAGGTPRLPAFVAALIILLFAFGSVVAAGLPIVTAAVGLAVGAMLTLVMARALAIPDWAPQVAEVLAIGVGVDYALLVLTRFRDALDATDDVEESLAEAVATAGRSVLFAGITVVIAVLGLFVVGVEYLRGTALATSLAVLVVMLTAITLLPALLAMLGRRVDRLKLPGVATAHERRERERDPDRMPLAARWSRQVQRHPWPPAIVSTLILLVLAVPATDMNIGFPDASNNPKGDITYKAFDMIRTGFGTGANGPFVVAIDFNEQRGANALAAANRVATKLERVDGVVNVSRPVPSPTGRSAMVIVTPEGAPQDRSTKRLVSDLRDVALPMATADSGVTTMLGGLTPSYIDSSDYVADHMVEFILAVVLVSLLILLLAFRSPLISVKAGVMNLLSVGASFGVIAYAAEGGWFGQLLGVDSPTPIAPFMPVLMFAVIFGLSMDYEVFLMSRVREEYLAGRETHDAVTVGLARTARVITAAAAIMFAVFLSFAFSDLIFLRLMGIGMAAAVLVDATLVRMVLVPALLQLFGEANWWIPRWLDRILPHWEFEALPQHEPPLQHEPAESSAPR